MAHWERGYTFEGGELQEFLDTALKTHHCQIKTGSKAASQYTVM